MAPPNSRVKPRSASAPHRVGTWDRSRRGQRLSRSVRGSVGTLWARKRPQGEAKARAGKAPVRRLPSAGPALLLLALGAGFLSCEGSHAYPASPEGTCVTLCQPVSKKKKKEGQRLLSS